MSDDAPELNSPEEIVSEQITDALKECGLLQATRVDDFRSSLAAGQLKSEDWALEIDLATATKEVESEQ